MRTSFELPIFGPGRNSARNILFYFYHIDENRRFHLTEDLRRKTMFETYNLNKSQLIFSLATRLPDGKFQIMFNSSVSSQIMIGIQKNRTRR